VHPQALENIKKQVAGGAGFLMLGGYNTFDNGDWRGSEIEELIPLELTGDHPGQVEDTVKIVPTDAGLRRFGYLLRLDDGGVVLNLGSAVIMPEVFLKALTVARNVNAGAPRGFVTCDLDMQRHYRPRMNVVQRPTMDSGKGYEITGHHEIMVPMLAWAVVERLDADRG
jgi:hypothetical protein